MKRIDTPRRSAFTLIELLVVITIIALLCSLLLAAVFRALTVVKEVQNRNEISQLAAAVASFKQTFNVNYLPSSLDPSTPQGQFYLQTLYPQAPPNWAPGPLQGHQCLVFFLGGLQQGGGCYGFSSNPQNPMAAPTAGEIRKGPFFDFNATRLKPNYGGYLDIYGVQPYAYFSTNGTINSYNPADCSLTAPYYYSAGNYVKPDSFQIISAGANMVFGPGGQWTPGSVPAQGSAGGDDIANFATGRLSNLNQ
jgi:prepilin-type N-terminal cleavage/methylation domain-containing protein